jgi:putative PIG3 family NAD(P)H quinone oxidoreductase
MDPTPQMLAVTYTRAGGPEVVVRRRLPRPVPAATDLLVEVRASGLNRGDIAQRTGEYTVPVGEVDIPGVEIAGVVVAQGESATGFRIGDRVFGVVPGGGFADYCLLDVGLANLVPEGWEFGTAAATAESWLTANEALFELGGLRAEQTVVVHAAASGVGTTMIQMCRLAGANVIGTVRSPEKATPVRAVGAHTVLRYDPSDTVRRVRELTDGQGADLVMDFVGGPRLAENLAMLRDGGCLVVLGLLGGAAASVDLAQLVTRRLRVEGCSLRSRPLPEKQAVNRRFRERWLHRLTSAEVLPVVHATYSIDQFGAAQEEMEQNRNVGKIVISTRGEMPENESAGHHALRPRLEVMLCGMVATLLRLPQVEVTADLFDLGVDSLDAARLVRQVELATGVELDLVDVLCSPSVGTLAALLASRTAPESSS